MAGAVTAQLAGLTLGGGRTQVGASESLPRRLAVVFVVGSRGGDRRAQQPNPSALPESHPGPPNLRWTQSEHRRSAEQRRFLQPGARNRRLGRALRGRPLSPPNLDACWLITGLLGSGMSRSLGSTEGGLLRDPRPAARPSRLRPPALPTLRSPTRSASRPPSLTSLGSDPLPPRSSSRPR